MTKHSDSLQDVLILNVDDSEGARYAKSRILRMSGFVVIEAAYGAEALKQAEAHAPDLILLDTKLPDFDGFEVCQRLRENPLTAKTLVLQTSASFLGISDKIKALEGGADNYLVEPIEADELIANIRALLRLRRVERQLSESELRFRQIAEHIDDVFWMYSPGEGKLLYVNPAYEKLWGSSVDALLTHPLEWLESVHADDREQIGALFDGLLALTSYETEYRLTSLNHRDKWISERGYVIAGEHGLPARVGRVSQDITARKLAELQAQTADRRKDEFLATLAHELRNPLGPILHSVELMALNPDPVRIEKGRQMIERQTRHLTHLVDDLLDISRITQGKVTIRREWTEIKSFINAAVEATQPFLESRRHTLSITLPEHDVWVYGDITRLSQVVSNLLNNAAKYTLQGGQISLKVETRGNHVILTIADNGIGISRDKLDSIFELFVQADHAEDRAQDGLGIGLSLVRNLVMLHDGDISVTSKGKNQGSEFAVSLPIMQTDLMSDKSVPEKSIIVASAPVASKKMKKILVVDDNVDATEMLVIGLRQENFEVVFAHEAATALDLAATFLPEVVILDIGLPGMNGYQLAQRVRSVDQLQAVRLIALSGYGSEADKARAVEAGFDVHLIKPTRIDEILQYLEVDAPRNKTELAVALLSSRK